MLLTWEAAPAAAAIVPFGPPLPPGWVGRPLLALAPPAGAPGAPVPVPVPVPGGPSRYALLHPGTPAALAPDAAPATAEAAAMSAEGPALLVDWQDASIRVLPGAPGPAPAFLVKTEDAGLRLVSGAGALRRHAGRGAVCSAGVNFFLGYGHPPPGSAMLRGVWPLPPGQVATLTGPEAAAPSLAPAASATPPDGADALEPRLAAMLGGALAGRVVGVVDGGLGLPAELLARVAVACGARRVVRLSALILPDSLSPTQSALTVLSGQPQADPALLAVAAAAARDPASEVLLLDLGAAPLLLARAQYARFAAAVAGADLSAGARRSLLGGFLRQGVFGRDLLFDLIGVFSEEERFRVIGPALAGEGFLAMADELGMGLEDQAGEAAILAAADADAALSLPAAARALTGIQAMAARPVLAPFLDPAIAATVRAAGPDAAARAAAFGGAPVTAEEPALRPADIAADRLAAALGPQAQLFRSGLLARTPPLVTLISRDQQQTPRQMRQAFALLALEKWLRILPAEA